MEAPSKVYTQNETAHFTLWDTDAKQTIGTLDTAAINEHANAMDRVHYQILQWTLPLCLEDEKKN